MKSEVNHPQQPKPGQGQQPPGPEKGGHGEGGGQPKPGNDRVTETQEIPDEIPKREIDRKPSNPQTLPTEGPEQGPKPQMPDKGESEENNDVQERSPDLLVEDDRDTESLVDKRDRFPFPNK
ncbi:hypothetical protein [Chitinophaga sp. XS-30]|uniref:hypothetical protein n=1 Tax=Chitinophaga sp. XS-30 TaxID=2604421 RepID=UPI0011DD62DE|nr:hypothetical protein [Chitinophaga sp. XS-30]QEH39979.1 hypothetical protein FW415_03500 [Chitinophaga sp. XS-30]